MYDQIKGDILYIMLYTVVTTIAVMASCYLLFRRSNAIAPDITPPVRLRRWTAAFLASLALSHVWYMPIFFLDSSYDVRTVDLVAGLLDSMTFFPLAIIVLLVMLQDRRRPLWPAFLMMTPLVAGSVWCVVNRSNVSLLVFYAYMLVLCVGIVIYMIRALRQYGRWLRDNYADLEHKEVWQSFVVLGITLLMFVTYASTFFGPIYLYAMQTVVIVMVCYLLWRVETLSDLSPCLELTETEDSLSPLTGDGDTPTVTHEYIGQLLQQHCIDAQLYLQHDLTIHQLAKAIGTNRYYLSQYFSQQGITYNAYINNLRINHFIELYHKVVSSQLPFTAQQLAGESGYRSYSTFGIAFKQRMGKTVTVWIRDNAK